MHFPESIYKALHDQLGWNKIHVKNISGGSINNSYQLSTSDGFYFCKVNNASKFPHLFQTEAKGLTLLENTGLIHTPKIKQIIETEEHQVLLLEWIISGNKTPDFWKTFGAQLAQIHTITQQQFGLDMDNYMGAVPQRNSLTTEWTSFFIEHRLAPLVSQCYQRNLLTTKHIKQIENLYTKVYSIFPPEPPSLLHGDLWSGNFMCNANAQPILIDPAPYFGHRSMDLGMTTLFGGFDQLFYESYHYHFPFPNNYQEQWNICNLYPLLLHLLLFGKTYLSSIETTLSEFQ